MIYFTFFYLYNLFQFLLNYIEINLFIVILKNHEKNIERAEKLHC